MSRQYNEIIDNSVIVGDEVRALIEPKNIKELSEAYSLMDEIEWWYTSKMHDEQVDDLEDALARQNQYIQEYIDSLENFDNTVLVNNISYLTNKYGIKIGTLENMLGISAGYISRTAKENSKKNMSIDVAWKIAELFEIDLTILLKVPLDGRSATDQYYLAFISKLISDTAEDKLYWEKEQADKLNALRQCENYDVPHDLFTYETFSRCDEEGYPLEVSELVFQSDSYGFNTAINGNCYKLKLKNYSHLYLMNISKANYRINDKNARAKELWIVDGMRRRQIICRNNDGSSLAPLVNRLYEIVEESSKHPKVGNEVKSIIDSFMIDDISDDEDFYRPF